jgi:hypothetical protein
MGSTRNGLVAAAFLGTLALLVVANGFFERKAQAQSRTAVQAPRFEVDPFWPKPLPNHWLLGSTIGVWVDARDNVWIIHRSSATLDNNEKGAELPTPIAECCKGAPPVLKFDKAGNLLANWGGPGPGYEWPESNHGIFIDHKGNVWIGGNGGGDSHVLKMTQDGKFLAQYGKQYARRIGPGTGPPSTSAAATIPKASAVSRRSSSNRRRMRPTSRMATSIRASPSWTPTRAR